MTYFQPMIAVPQSQAENVIACHSSFDEFCCSETTFYFLKVKMQNSKKKSWQFSDPHFLTRETGVMHKYHAKKLKSSIREF